MSDCGLLLELRSSHCRGDNASSLQSLAGSCLAAIPLTMTTDLLDSLSRNTVPRAATNSLKVIVCVHDWFESFSLLI